MIVAACSGGSDGGSGAQAGTPVPIGGTGTTGGASAAGTGGAAPVGGTSATGTGAMPATGGASGTGAVDAGATDAGDGGDATDAGVDAGGDAGAPATVCSAPTTIATPGNTCPGGAPPGLQATLLMGGFSYPVFVTHAPGDATRLFVVERGGTIVIVDMNGTNKRTFLDISTPVVSGSGNDERGLLGLAFHPDYPSDPRFFVNYTGGAVSLSTYVESYEATSPDEADPNSDVSIHSFTQPEGNHNGGMVAFGPDGCLYVGTGDGGGADDLHSSAGCPMGNGQCLSTSLGKILRIDVDDPSARPPGNMASPAQRHVWDYGLRNPWRFSFDRATGDLYIGDVGQGTLEEVDVEPKGAGNLNYGWRIAEGSGCRPGGGGCDLSGLVPPVDEYGHSSGNDCIVGGYVYRGSAISGLQGWYLYGDNGSNRVWAFVWDGNGRCNDSTADLTSQLSLSGDLTSFGEDANGELYMTTITGNLYRIDAM